MVTVSFSILPAEIHVSIAEHCENNELVNLCLTSKWVNERCLHVLYYHVNLQLDQRDSDEFCRMKARLKRLQQFVRTLRSHPEYRRHIRSLQGTICIPSNFNCQQAMITEEELWSAMQSITLVRNVDLAFEYVCPNCLTVLKKQIPNDLFQSATSVRIAGNVHYRLAKAILDAINPATLKHLSLDTVRDSNIRVGHIGKAWLRGEFPPGDTGEDGRIIALGAIAGLLTTLTGRSTALRTLELRRAGQTRDSRAWPVAAEEASYIKCATFIRSVQGTLEKFTFEQAGELITDKDWDDRTYDYRTMNERFRRLLFPTIVSGNWSCLTTIELKGVLGSTGQAAEDAVTISLMTMKDWLF